MIPRRSDGTSRSSCSSGRSPSWRPTSTPRRAAGSASSPSSTVARAGLTGAAARARTGSRGAAGSRPSPRASTCASHGGWSGFRSSGPRSREGELSYSKVRALTRVEDVEREEELLALAERATAAQLERLVRGLPRGRRARALRGGEPERWVRGATTTTARCCCGRGSPPRRARSCVAALEAAREAAWARVVPEAGASAEALVEVEDASAEALVDVENASAEAPATGGDALADALVLMADTMLAAGMPRAPAATGTRWWCTSTPPCWLGRRRGRPLRARRRRPLAPETARRLACDARIVALLEARRQDARRRPQDPLDPAVASPGARRPRPRLPVPRLRSRTRGRPPHPSLGARGRARASTTSCTLCRHHHGLVHEGGFTVERRPAARSCSAAPTGAGSRRVRPHRPGVSRRCGPGGSTTTPACNAPPSGWTWPMRSTRWWRSRRPAGHWAPRKPLASRGAAGSRSSASPRQPRPRGRASPGP